MVKQPNNTRQHQFSVPTFDLPKLLNRLNLDKRMKWHTLTTHHWTESALGKKILFFIQALTFNLMVSIFQA